MTEYRYLATDVRTGAALGELQLGAVSYSDELNDGGDMSAELDLSITTLSGQRLARALLDASTPRRTRLWVERDGALVWSGIVWTRSRPRKSTGVVRLQAMSSLRYFGMRRLTDTLSYTAIDQLAVARDLINWAQAQPGGYVRVLVGAEVSGVQITRLPLAYGHELRPIADMLRELAEGDTGFDASIDPVYDGGTPTEVLRLHYPRRGRRVDESNVAFFRAGGDGGNLIDWDVTEDGLDSPVAVYGIGAGEGDGMLRVVSTRTDLLDAGYPLTESVISHKAITDPDALLALTRAAVAAGADTQYRWSIDVDPDDRTAPFGSWVVGDDCRITIDDDPQFPAGASGDPGLSIVQRIIGQRVAVPDDGGPDEVTLTLAAARG